MSDTPFSCFMWRRMPAMGTLCACSNRGQLSTNYKCGVPEDCVEKHRCVVLKHVLFAAEKRQQVRWKDCEQNPKVAKVTNK